MATMRYDELAAELYQLPARVRLVAVDGCGGAGKTTFAARLARACGDSQIVATDDFASWDEPLGWWPRMLREVIEPLAAGRPAVFRRYDWDARQLGDTVEVAAGPVVLLEGVSSSRSEWSSHLAFSVWIDAPRETRLRRGLDRDGQQARDQWIRWMADEDGYVARDRPIDRADVVVDGDPAQPHDPETEFVLTRQRRRAGVAGSR